MKASLTLVIVLSLSTTIIFLNYFSLVASSIVLCDFVEDPGTVKELDPAVYNKDINTKQADGDSESNLEVVNQIEQFMSDL